MTNKRKVTLTEFFCGGGGMSLGFKQAGVNILKAYDFDKYAVESYKHNISDHVEQKSVTDLKGEDIPTSDVWTFGFPCFVENTMILCKTGFKEIQNVQVGDEVWTHENRWKKVTHTMSKEAPIIQLKGHNYHQMVTTKEHPFWASETKGIQPSWILAKDMKNKYWSTPINIQTDDKPKYPNEQFKLTKDILFLTGLWLDYGFIDYDAEKNTDTIVFVLENNLKEKVISILEELQYDFDFSVEFYLKQAGFSKIQVYSKELFTFFIENFVDQYRMKKTPLWLLSLTKEEKEIFLDAILIRYLSLPENKIESIDKDYALFLKLLLESLEYQVSLRETYSDDLDDNIYEITYEKETFDKERIQEDKYFEQVYDVIDLNEVRTVYNLEVEDDNSYVADTFVVHNCQDISVAGKMKGMIKGETRSGLFYEIMRLLEETPDKDKPKVILAENVKQVKHYFEPIEEEFKAQGYTFTYILYNSKYFNVAQNRERYFMLGVHKSIAKEFKFKEHPNNPIPPLSKFLEKNVDEKYYLDVKKATTIIEGALSKTKELSLDNIHAILNPSRIIMRQNGRRMKNNEEEMFTLTATEVHGVVERSIQGVGYLDIRGTQSLRRVYHTEGIAPTLTTAQGGNMQVKILEGEKTELLVKDVNDENIFDYYTLRKLTPREYARLQGFPDSYEQIVSNSQFYKQMGNAVTVNVAEYIAKQIIEFLKEEL